MQTSACGWWSSAARGRNGWFGTGLNTRDNEEHNLAELESSHRHKPWVRGWVRRDGLSFGVNRFQYRRLKVKYYLWMIYCWVSIKQMAVITGERFARCKSTQFTAVYLCSRVELWWVKYQEKYSKELQINKERGRESCKPLWAKSQVLLLINCHINTYFFRLWIALDSWTSTLKL